MKMECMLLDSWRQIPNKWSLGTNAPAFHNNVVQGQIVAINGTTKRQERCIS